MHDADWKRSFPDTWAKLLADGIMDDIDRFGEAPSPSGYDPPEILREPGRYGFIGPGPYELHTEVWVSRVDGSVLSVYIEID